MGCEIKHRLRLLQRKGLLSGQIQAVFDLEDSMPETRVYIINEKIRLPVLLGGLYKACFLYLNENVNHLFQQREQALGFFDQMHRNVIFRPKWPEKDVRARFFSDHALLALKAYLASIYPVLEAKNNHPIDERVALKQAVWRHFNVLPLS